ncbi:ParB N-terminal domain-containing protein, partial [Myxococcota bacterium]|nr:ParB N-terminal domain-containing protein [Myxococcota bacterium]
PGPEARPAPVVEPPLLRPAPLADPPTQTVRSCLGSAWALLVCATVLIPGDQPHGDPPADLPQFEAGPLSPQPGAGTGGVEVGVGPEGGSAASKGGGLFKGRADPFGLEPTHGLTMGRNKFAQFKAQIGREGIKEPIKFVTHDGRRYVVDGHHRLRAAKELGLKDVPVEEVQLPHGGYNSVEDLLP